jgi:hypothetical protein
MTSLCERGGKNDDFHRVFDNHFAFLPFALTDYVMGDWILKDDTYFIRNVSILCGDPIPFSSKLDLCKFDFIYNFYYVSFSCLYTHGSDLQKGKVERWPIDSILHTDYCQISRLPIATPIG